MKLASIVAANDSAMTQNEHLILTGKTTEHLADEGLWTGVLHRDVVGPFERLRLAASAEGFDLAIISGYRSFERQLRIWNAKARGERAVLDDKGDAIELECLNSTEKMQAILRWSALPGASRHHWGTDFDIYDAAAVDDDYQVQLVWQETADDGPFAKIHRWLDEYLPKTDFYRPYDQDRGGTGPEPWHLSYAPLADQFAKAQNTRVLEKALAGVDIELGDDIPQYLDSLYERYVQVPSGAIRVA